MKNPSWRWAAPVIAAVFLSTGCKDESAARRIKELEQEATDHVSEVETLNQRLQEAENERNKLRGELDDSRREATRAKNDAEQLQRQMDAMRKIEEAKRENERQAAQRNPVEDARKAVQEKLAAVWQIEGDQGSCRGVVCEADGKTWLYFPPTSLKGSAKLAVKDAAGTAVTKFGDLQIAADANLARLEIKQDAPVRLAIDAKAELAANPRLFLPTPANDGGALRIDEVSPGKITPAEIELNADGSSTFRGLPVFHAETGALLAITVPAPNFTADIWAAAQPSDFGMTRSARLDRGIEWKTSTIGSLLAERRKIDELNKLTRLVAATATLSPGTSGLRMTSTVAGGTISARQILEENKSVSGVQELFKLDENLAAQKVRASEADIRRQFAGMAGSIGSASRRVATELKAMKPSPCNRADIEAALKWNEEAGKKLDETLSSGGR